VDVPPEQGEQIVRQAIADLGWRVLEDDGRRLVVKEVTPNSISFTWAAKIEVVISEEEDGFTEVALRGSIVGAGPVQSGHLRGQVGNLKNRIAAAGAAQAPAVATGGISGELQRLVQLHKDGVLTDDEFARAKAQALAAGG
jgi:hypothetical protein